MLELNERLEQDIQLKKRKLSSILGLNLNWSVRKCLNNWHICSSVSSWILGILVGWVCQLYMWNTGMFEYVIFEFLKILKKWLNVYAWLIYIRICQLVALVLFGVLLQRARWITQDSGYGSWKPLCGVALFANETSNGEFKVGHS